MNIERIKNCGQYGVLADQPPQELPLNAWTDGANVRVNDGSITNAPGHIAVYDPPTVAPYWCYPIQVAVSYFWLYAGSTKIYATDGVIHTNITRQTTGTDVDYSMDAQHLGNGGILSGVLIANNGEDEPQAWVGPSLGVKMQDLSVVSDWTSTHRCKVMRPFKNYLIALDVTKGSARTPYKVKWNHPSDPGTVNGSWDETDATKDAGENDLIEGGGFVIDGLPLRGNFIIYRETSTWVMRHIGGQFIFDFEELFESAGILAPNCAVEYRARHYVLTQGDVIMHDGHTPQSIIDLKNRRFLFNDIDSTNYKKCFLVLNQRKEEIWICYPSAGSTYVNKALVHRIDDGSWAPRDLPNVSHIQGGIIDETGNTTWASDTETWNVDDSGWNQSFYNPSEIELLMAGVNDTKLYKGNSTNTENGTVRTCYVERKGMQLGDYGSVTHVNAILPKIEATKGTQIQISVGGEMTPNEGISWSPEYTFTVGEDDRINCRVSGRLTAIKFQTVADVAWRLQSYDIEYSEGGRF